MQKKTNNHIRNGKEIKIICIKRNINESYMKNIYFIQYKKNINLKIKPTMKCHFPLSAWQGEKNFNSIL